MLSAPAPDRPDSHLRNCRRSLRYAALVCVDRHVCTKSSTASEKRTRHLWARPMESVGIASIVRSAPLCQSNESSPSSPGQTHAPCPGRRGVRIRGLTWMVPAAGASVARQAARPVSDPPRVVLAVAPDREHEDRRVLVTVKNNLTTPAPAMAFELLQAPGALAAVLAWEP